MKNIDFFKKEIKSIVDKLQNEEFLKIIYSMICKMHKTEMKEKIRKIIKEQETQDI